MSFFQRVCFATPDLMLCEVCNFAKQCNLFIVNKDTGIFKIGLCEVLNLSFHKSSLLMMVFGYFGHY